MTERPERPAGPQPHHPETMAVGHGYDAAAAFGAIKPPIVLTSTFTYPTAGAAKEAHRTFFETASPDEAEYIYARLDHPNLRMVQERFAALDGAEACAAFSSGMAAISATLLATVRPGDTVVHTAPLYGGTLGLLTGLLAGLGVRSFAIPDALSPASIAETMGVAVTKGRLSVVLVESPANPTAGLADIRAVVGAANALGRSDHRPLVLVDNTFLGPFGQRPLEEGADLSVTSLTKYAGGHSDLLGGAVTGSAAAVVPVRRLRTSLGTHLDPFSCWMMLRSLETLPLRAERTARNAATVAAFLRDHPKVRDVTYLGFLPEGSAARAVFERQCRSAGSTFSFRIAGGEREAFAMLDRLRVIRMAVSLGGTETLICHSATTTHYSVAPEVRAAVGVDDSALRISIGIEHPDDLVADLDQALAAV
ncbi:cystathionine gamma-synthase family protein [Acuticoccus sediminis]|uniref:Cystathionine gamma-synthase family protein n=1 Tax=Acuticoccus sediminis TaxID=2184697 RepID=A0A8B2NPJ5_9HYPH|nr:cystathionine gamma-synthase family protein [Acuticoccus sediminis]RAI00189.1 cystathionine gamma-synthase family protein [Acuticoccus sediminis]